MATLETPLAERIRASFGVTWLTEGNFGLFERADQHIEKWPSMQQLGCWTRLCYRDTFVFDRDRVFKKSPHPSPLPTRPGRGDRKSLVLVSKPVHVFDFTALIADFFIDHH